MKTIRMIVSLLLLLSILLEQPQLTKNRMLLNKQIQKILNYTYILNERSNRNHNIKVYDIIYNLNRGENHYLNPNVYYEQRLPVLLMPAFREGYNFAGWYTDSHYKQPITGITNCKGGNLILYAKWTKIIHNSTSIQRYSYMSRNLTRAPERKLSNVNYRILEDLDIPGMPSTRYDDYFEGRTFSTDQCPQGLCVSKDFILISSYSTNRKAQGCLHVFDRSSGEYLVSLSMPARSHLGGIAYDGESVWICHSFFQGIQRIAYQQIKELADAKPKRIVDSSGMGETFFVSNTPSCMTFYDGKLWIATHTRFFESVMRTYCYEDGQLIECEEFAIPDKVQGVCLDEQGHVYLSTSFGRNKSSYIKAYASVYALSKHPEKPVEVIEMPPCSEEIDIVGNELLVLFESGARKYCEGTDGNGRCTAPLDHLVAINLSSF